MSEDSDNRGEARALSLRVAELACRRGDRTVFAGLDFAARAGDVVWIRGGNGSGKTTLLRTLAGLASPSAGSVAVEGGGTRPVVYLAHANAIKDELTVAESLRFLLRLDGLGASDLVLEQALGRFGLAHRSAAPVRTLSQGQRRRVALARLAALPRPALWLLDEPFDALDAGASATLMEVLVEHSERRGIVVLTSHVPLPGAMLRPVEVHLDAMAAA